MNFFSNDIIFYLSEFIFFLSLLIMAFSIGRYLKTSSYKANYGDVKLNKFSITALMISAVAFIFCNILNLGLIISLGISILLFFLLIPWLKIRDIKIRSEKFDRSLSESLQIVTSSLRAGLTLKDAFSTASNNAPEPFAVEANILLKEFHLGIPMETALHNMRNRVNTPNANLAIGAMMISSKMGGKLPQMLSRISRTIEERERVNDQTFHFLFLYL